MLDTSRTFSCIFQKLLISNVTTSKIFEKHLESSRNIKKIVGIIL